VPRPDVGSWEDGVSEAKRVLLAEDSRMLRSAIARHLEGVGFTVAAASDGQEALALHRQAPFPVALLDYELPDTEGLTLMARIKEIEPAAEVVIMTSVGTEEIAARALNGGASAYLTKTTRGDMLAILQRYLDEAFHKRALLIQNRRLLEELRSHNEQLEGLVRERTEELETAYAHLEDLDRMKFDLITLVSHQIRTPLASILGYSELILQGCFEGDAEGMTSAVRDIHGQGIRLSRFVEDATSYLAWRSGHVDVVPDTFDASAVVADVLRVLDDRIQGKRLTLDVEVEGQAVVTSDSGHYGEVVRRVLANATEYSDPGGRIRISISHATQPDGDADALLTRIQDEGRGISAEAMKGLFRPLEVCRDLRNHSDGNGLGLAICWEILRALGGRIALRSDGLGKGCQVDIWIPLAPEKGARSRRYDRGEPIGTLSSRYGIGKSGDFSSPQRGEATKEACEAR